MGYRPEPKQYKLNFKDSEYEGLEVTMASLSVSEFNDMLARAIVSGLTEETLKANSDTLALFASKLVSWNLEDEKGKPVPATLKGVQAQDRSLITAIIVGWQVALVTVPKPSQTQLSNGEISPEDLEALAASSSPPS